MDPVDDRGRRTLREELPAFARRNEEAGASRFARMTPEQRLAVFLELCDLTDSIVNARPDAQALRKPTPRSPASEALWQRLMTRKAAGDG